MGRRRTAAADLVTARSFGELKSWPQDALDWLHVEFARKREGAGPTYAELLAELAERWHLTWNDSALSRYYGYWASTLRIEDQAREEAAAIVERLVASPSPDLLAATKQLLQQQRLLALTRLEAADPAEVVRLGLAHDRNELREKQLAVQRELAELTRRRVELQERAAEIASKVEEKVKAAGKALDPEVLRTIREVVYGLPAMKASEA
jgi:hypothetical protein